MCDDLDKVKQRVLWGSLEDKRKISLVVWDDVCKVKKRGGLGLKHAKLQNKSLLVVVRT